MTGMMMVLMIAADIHVRASNGCASVEEIRAALEAAEIDPSESVTVTVVPNASNEEPHRVFVDAQLLGVLPMHRETALRAVECADVPALIVVWLGQHRHDAAAAVFVPPPAVTNKAKPRVVADRPNTIDAMDQREWSPCAGPPPCLTFRGGVGLGATIDGPMIIAETGWQFASPWGISAGATLNANPVGVYPAGFLGVLYSAPVGSFEISGRGALAVGQTNVTTLEVAPVGEQQCPAPGTQPATIEKHQTRLFVGPRLSMRARWAWGYLEGGAVWQLGAKLTPEVFAVVGVQLFGA
jgi:hypothetical protein